MVLFVAIGFVALLRESILAAHGDFVPGQRDRESKWRIFGIIVTLATAVTVVAVTSR